MPTQPGIINTAARSGLRVSIRRYPRLLITLVIAVLAWPGLSSIPPLDRDEPQFAQPARQMLESGDFIDIRFQSAPFEEKPILTFWLQAASAAIFGGRQHHRIAAYRLPSVLGTWLAALLTYELGTLLFSQPQATAGAVLLASLPLVQSQAHQARADALLLAAMMGAVVPLAGAFMASQRQRAPGPHQVALFWFSVAAGILIKGPIVPVLIALSAAALSWARRDGKWLGLLYRWWAIPLSLVILLPWPLALLHASGASFFVHAWRGDILPKLVSGQESHGAPPLAYALSAPLTLWPAALLLPAAMEFAWRRRSELPVVLCLATVLPGWLLFELAPTKLPHYILPFVPMLSLLAVTSADRFAASGPSRMSSRIGALLFAISGLLIAAAMAAALVRLGSGLDLTAAAGTVALVTTSVGVAAGTWMGHLRYLGAAAIASGMLASLLIFGLTLPRLEQLWVAERAASVASRVSEQLPVLIVGYREPSLVFLLGTSTRFVDEKSAVAALQRHESAVAIVASNRIAELSHLAQRSAVHVQLLATIGGIDPVHGRPVQLVVVMRVGERLGAPG